MTSANDNRAAPPPTLDGARVIAWARASSEPFGYVTDGAGTLRIAIHGLAICKYDATGSIYRFSCDQNWEVVQDGSYGSVEEAIAQLPEQYRNVEAEWHPA